MDVLTTVMQLGAGALIGACIGMTGIGGGVLILPVLTLGFGLPSTVAVGTAHLYTCLCKIPAAIFHFRQGTIRFRTSAYLLAGAVPGTVAVALWITDYTGALDPSGTAWQALQSNLRQFIAAVVILSALLILWHMLMGRGSRAATGDRIRNRVRVTGAKIVLVPLLGTVIGGLIAATSVGSGVLIVPLMIVIFRLTAVDTVGSSIFIALLLTLASSIIYAGSSQMDIATAMVMAAGSLVGVPAGVRMSGRIRERQLQVTITGLALAAGALMLVGA